MAANPARNKIYIANGGSNNVTIIDGATNSTATVAVGIAPNSLAVNPMTDKSLILVRQFHHQCESDGRHAHKISLYLLDWDSTARDETISILGANSNTILNTQTFSSFHDGEYVHSEVQGHVLI